MNPDLVQSLEAATREVLQSPCEGSTDASAEEGT